MQPRREPRRIGVGVRHPRKVSGETLKGVAAPVGVGSARFAVELDLEPLERGRVMRRAREGVLPGGADLLRLFTHGVLQPRALDEQRNGAGLVAGSADFALQVAQHRAEVRASVLLAPKHRVRRSEVTIGSHRRFRVRHDARVVAEEHVGGDGHLEVRAGDADAIAAGLEDGDACRQEIHELALARCADGAGADGGRRRGLIGARRG